MNALSVCWLAAILNGPAPADEPSPPAADVTRPPAALIENLALDAFYKKHCNADGIPIVSSEKVNDFALREAAYLIRRMLAHRPDVRQAIIDNKVRVVVMASTEFTTDVPEHRDLEPASYWDRRARGLGATPRRPATSCGEENLLRYPGDPYAAENILIHEFAHTIHHMGLDTIDKQFDKKLEQIYDRAMAKGLWARKYAANNRAEYWAEAVQSWFDTNRPPDHDHNHVDTRAELLEYDPDLAKLVAEVFGHDEWRYQKPRDRAARAHLTGYDPTAAPRFAWPERLREAARRDRDKTTAPASQPHRKTIEHTVRDIEGWQVYVDTHLLQGDNKQLGNRALRILANKLHEITMILPAERLPDIRDVPIYFDLDHELSSMQYHPSAGWLTDHGYDSAMTQAVHVPRVSRLIGLQRSNHQPAVVLHELAHAYHDRVLGFNHPAIKQAYDRAIRDKLYDNVLHIKGKTTRHYALTDHKEFFAEMTEAYFHTNDFYPFVRAELEQHDPETFALLEKIWGKLP